MKVLILWPPHVPTYFNSAYHLMLWEIVVYIRKIKGVDSVRGIDAGLLNLTYPVLMDKIVSFHPDIVAIHIDFDNLEGLEKSILLLKEMLPEIKFIVYGRMPSIIPNFFQKYNIDAIVYSGDWELGIENYLMFLWGRRSLEELKGIFIKNKERGWIITKKGDFLSAHKLQFPDQKEVPYEEYNKFYKEHIPFIKHPGISGLKEFPVPIARGCPINCSFCIIKKYQGLVERRKDFNSVLKYIKQTKKIYNFDYVSFIAPTFTLDKNWVENLCKNIILENIRWKCCTVPTLVNKQLIKLMAKSGCFRISFGVETLSSKLQDSILSKIKKTDVNYLKRVFEWCKDDNIQVNWLIMIGLPGETWDDFKFTMKKLKEIGGDIRPVFYTSYDKMKLDMTTIDIFMFNRYFINNKIPTMVKKDYYNIVLDVRGDIK